MVGLITQWFYYKFPESIVFSACQGSDPTECIVPGVYAMVSAAAALAGGTRMTVSLAVISNNPPTTFFHPLSPFVAGVLVLTRYAKWKCSNSLGH